MWPMGHAAVAYLCYTVVVRRQPGRTPADGPAIVVFFASLLPDLVDKPLAWYAGVLPTGRSLAHSLLVIVPLIVLCTLIVTHYDRGAYALAFAVGTLSHVTMDALPAFWTDEASAGFLLWPAVSVTSPESFPTVLGLLRETMFTPYFFLECGLFTIAVLVWRFHGYPGFRGLTLDGSSSAPAHE